MSDSDLLMITSLGADFAQEVENADLPFMIASIVAGFAYRAINDPEIDKALANDIMVIALKYIGGRTPQEQIAMRLKAIDLGRKTAPRFLVTGEVAISDTEYHSVTMLLGRQYPYRTIWKARRAMTLCTEASDKELYFGVIEVFQDGVGIAVLPWAWGWLNWTWEFKEGNRVPGHRDYFQLRAN